MYIYIYIMCICICVYMYMCASVPQVLWGPVDIPDTSQETHLSPYDFIYAKYEYQREDVAGLYQLQPQTRSIFRGVDRLKLIYSIMTARKMDGGCGLDVYRLTSKGALLSFFPLHDRAELLNLQERWLKYCQLPWHQPIEEVKDYFGEKIGLYFLWLAHYTSWLLVAGIVGFLSWINVAVKGNDPNAEIMPYFATFMAFWATLFLESWKRKESTHAMKWGTTGFESEEQDRPQFEGTLTPSPVTGKPHLYFSRTEKAQRVSHSTAVILTFIALVIAVVGSIFYMKLVLSRIKALTISGTQLGGIIAALANAIQIQVMNIIYGGVAIRLTDYENHSECSNSPLFLPSPSVHFLLPVLLRDGHCLRGCAYWQDLRVYVCQLLCCPLLHRLRETIPHGGSLSRPMHVGAAD